MASHNGDIPSTDVTSKELRVLKDVWCDAPIVSNLAELVELIAQRSIRLSNNVKHVLAELSANDVDVLEQQWA